MVRRTRIISWTPFALNSKQEIFSYWNNRNKSKTYSQKLNLEFRNALIKVAKIPKTGIQTDEDEVRITLFTHFELIYKISEQEINVLDIFDTRQNPSNYPLKEN